MKKPFQISRRQLVIGTASAGLSSLCAAPALAIGGTLQ